MLREPMSREQGVESERRARRTAMGLGLRPVLRGCFLLAQGDLQSQAMVRAVARQVCEQLIQSEYITVSSVVLCPLSKLGSALPRS